MLNDFLIKRGEFMKHVLVIYEIEDYKKWKRIYDDNTANRKINGSKEAYIYRNEDNHLELAVIYSWDDLDNARKYFASEDFKNKMFAAGVHGEPEIRYIEEIERTIA